MDQPRSRGARLNPFQYLPPNVIHAGLFVLTCFTALVAGFYAAGLDPLELAVWGMPSGWVSAASYAVPLMTILFAHEMGHYLQARRHGVDVSMPYFLPGLGPIPGLGIIPFFGTFGAFIKMRLGRIKALPLLEIGAWGPLAGFVVTVPVLLVGIALSDVQPLPEDGELLTLGNSLLLMAAERLFHPDIPDGHDVFLHPMALAGWVGCLLTALNLLPIGQLDGGHIAYCVLGETFNRYAPFLFGALILLGVFVFPGWLVFGILIWVMGPKHPKMMEGPPVRGRGLWLAVAGLVMFLVTFTPQPVVVDSLPKLLGLW